MSDAASLPRRVLIAEALAAWGFSACLVIAAAYAAGVNPFAVSSYVRADSGHYLTIARLGYEFFSCARLPGYDPAHWCGNAGWMPGYPLLIRAMALLRLDHAAAGLLLSCLLQFANLIVLRLLIEKAFPGRQGLTCLLAAAVFPGGIYFFAVFPISLLMFGSLLTLLFLSRGSYLQASLTAAAGGFAYATGFLLAGVVVIGILATSRMLPWSKRIAAAGLYGAIAFSGFCAVLIMHQIVLGHWNAFFLVQAKYGHGLYNPVDTIAYAFRIATLGMRTGVNFFREAQTLMVCVIVLAALACTMRHFRKVSRVEWLAATHVALFWLFPLLMGKAASLTRAEANIIPLVILLARMPQVVQIGIAASFAVMAFGINIAFFRFILI